MRIYLSLLLSILGITPCFSTAVKLTQSKIDNSAGYFVVDKEYNLDGKTIFLPSGYKLKFTKGSLDNGTIYANNATIVAPKNKRIFKTKIIIKGKWNVNKVYDTWFELPENKNFVSNNLINNIFALSNDDVSNEVFFSPNRVYYCEVPYKGRADLGEIISYSLINGKKRRNYFELYGDKFANLRLFCIPSNTKLYFNSTVKLNATKQGVYFIFWEYGKENVFIKGNGTIAGDAKEHLYEETFVANYPYYGELGNLINCYKCNNFYIEGITLKDAFGDCLVYQGSNLPWEKGNRKATNLTLKNVKIISARRNGVTLGASNVSIIDCSFMSCGIDDIRGTEPKSAIDFEPDDVNQYPEICCHNVVMKNCFFSENFFDVNSYIVTTNKNDKYAVTIKNCHFSSPIHINTSSSLKFEKCYIPSIYTKNKTESMYVSLSNCCFQDCTFGRLKRNIITDTINQISFINCNIQNKE